MKNTFLRLTISCGAFFVVAHMVYCASDGVYPLTENSWSNPEFKKRFLGSYGFDMEINPKITSEEAELLGVVAEFMNTDTGEAIRQLEAAITLETSAAIIYTIGSLYLQEGELDKAIEHYRTSIERFPNFFRAYQNIGYALVQKGDYAGAKPMLIEAIEIGGGNGTLYGLLGYCFLNTGDASFALDSYRQALLFQPDSKDWLLGKLNSLLDTGMTQEAIGMLSDMIEKDPSNANFWMMQANAFMGESDYEKAIANLELLDRMGGNSSRSLALLGDLLLNENLPHLAVERYKKAAGFSELGADKVIRMAEGLGARGAYTEAVALVDELTSSRTNFTLNEQLMILNLKAEASIAMGRADEAASILEDIVTQDPLNGKALLSLGDYYRSQNDLENAMIQYERASKVKGFESKGLVALARVEVTLKDYANAVSRLKRANALDPKDYLEDYIRRLEAVLRSS